MADYLAAIRHSSARGDEAGAARKMLEEFAQPRDPQRKSGTLLFRVATFRIYGPDDFGSQVTAESPLVAVAKQAASKYLRPS